jgi:hypothetical protein
MHSNRLSTRAQMAATTLKVSYDSRTSERVYKQERKLQVELEYFVSFRMYVVFAEPV